MKTNIPKITAILLIFAAIFSTCKDKRDAETPEEPSKFCMYFKAEDMHTAVSFVDKFFRGKWKCNMDFSMRKTGSM